MVQRSRVSTRLPSGSLIPALSAGLQEEAEVLLHHLLLAFSPDSPKLFQAAYIHPKLFWSWEL